jgi:hypothetical protein
MWVTEIKDMFNWRLVDILAHNLQVYENGETENIVKFGFKRIVLNRNVPKNCELPNLQSIYVLSPVHDVSGIAKFKNVTELGFVGKCECSLEILSIMGNQITSLHMCVPSVSFSSIFNCCKKLKNLKITVGNVENSEEMWSSDSLMNLETFVFIMSENPASVPNMFLYRVMQAPMLKILDIFNACTRREETKQAIADVSNGTILQNLVRFRFFRSFVDSDQSMDDDYCRGLVRILLKCCAAYCPKLTEARLDGAIITRAFLDAEQRRMELLFRSH